MPSTTRQGLPRLPKAHARRVLDALVSAYPTVECGLAARDAFELVVATVLSAQCTDARVNLVTPALFERFPDAHALARVEPAEVEPLVHATGFYRAKAKNLVGLARALVERHEGQVPADLDALTALPGVGRKTAHVVLGNAFALASGVVVDTHVRRLSFRLGLTRRTDPVGIERELSALIPRDHWINFSHRLIAHGRATCRAIRPACHACAVATLCPRRGLTASRSKLKPDPDRTPRPDASGPLA